MPYKRSIPKSTLLLAAVCAVLSAATAAVGWFAFHSSPRLPNTPAQDMNLPLSLPETIPQPVSNQLSATSELLFDTQNNSIAFEHNGFERRPIASLTKLVTAMVALDNTIPLQKEADINLDEYVIGGQLLLQPGERVTMKDLLAASLVGSANNTTLAYVRQLGIPTEEFIRQMNRKAIALGLEQTEFFDVTGLDSRNVSTAYEVARLASEAFTKYPLIAQLTSQKSYDFTVRVSNREHSIKNTNKLISEQGQTLTGSKTGFLYEAGYCLVARGDGPARNRIAVVLGSSSEEESFADIQRLLYTDEYGI